MNFFDNNYTDITNLSRNKIIDNDVKDADAVYG